MNLCEAIKANQIITHLNLAKNFIRGSDHFKNLAEALKMNKCITHLHLMEKYFEYAIDSFKLLCEELKLNQTITCLFSRNSPAFLPKTIQTSLKPWRRIRLSSIYI